MNDSFLKSAMVGRIAAAILALTAFGLSYFGYTLGPEDQAAGVEIIVMVCTGIASILAVISKVRESKKE